MSDPALEVVAAAYRDAREFGGSRDEAFEAAVAAYMRHFPRASSIDARFAVEELLGELEG